MNKDDELVWVFPDCKLKAITSLPGVTADIGDWTYFIRDVLETCRFMRRGDVEDDPTMQQVIPYVVVSIGGVYLVYNRGKKGRENRLADEWSIGIGGHINPEDKSERVVNPFDVVMHAMKREVTEEIGVSKAILDSSHFQFLGLLKSNASPVNQVHFGVVFILRLPEVELKTTGEVDRYHWVTKEKLAEYSLEEWSEIVRKELI